MKAIRHILMMAVVLATSFNLCASDDGLRHTTDVLCLLPDATALGVSIAKHDTEGLKQLGLSTATCLVVNYGLELCIRKDRPDGTGHHAFPSTHTAVAFNGSTYLMNGMGACQDRPSRLVGRIGRCSHRRRQCFYLYPPFHGKHRCSNKPDHLW